MKYIDYIRDQLSNIGAQLFAMISCCVFLRGANAEAQMITIMLLIWLIIWLIHFNFVFFQRRNYLREIQSLVEKLDKKYLIGEIMKYPSRADDRVYYSIIKAADKS